MAEFIRVKVTREDIPADAPEDVKLYPVISGTTDDGQRVSFKASGRLVSIVRVDGCYTIDLEPGEILPDETEQAGE